MAPVLPVVMEQEEHQQDLGCDYQLVQSTVVTAVAAVVVESGLPVLT
jgi:hypothetical protein